MKSPTTGNERSIGLNASGGDSPSSSSFAALAVGVAAPFKVSSCRVRADLSPAPPRRRERQRTSFYVGMETEIIKLEGGGDDGGGDVSYAAATAPRASTNVLNA